MVHAKVSYDIQVVWFNVVDKKTGKEKLQRGYIRQMDIRGDFPLTPCYHATKRGQTIRVKMRKRPLRGWWDKTPILETDCKWAKEGSYTFDQFRIWLKQQIGTSHPLEELLTREPEPKDEAA